MKKSLIVSVIAFAALSGSINAATVRVTNQSKETIYVQINDKKWERHGSAIKHILSGKSQFFDSGVKGINKITFLQKLKNGKERRTTVDPDIGALTVEAKVSFIAPNNVIRIEKDFFTGPKAKKLKSSSAVYDKSLLSF